MKFLLTVALLLGSHVLKADTLDDQIYSLSRKISTNVYSSNRLTADEKMQVVKALNNASYLLERVGGNNGGGRPDYPSYPSYPPSRPLACDQEPAFQETFVRVKAFAYSTTGLNLTSEGATQYALEWTKQYSCAQAPRFIENFSRVKRFAYATSGLNLTDAGATDFAKAYAQSLCQGYELESEFQRAYQFAYSSGGLNMTSSAATEYAKKQVMQNAFSCRY